MVNKVTVINSKGEVFQQDIDDNKARITSTINQIMNVSNNDQNTINPISYSVESANVTITIVKNDLDASLFTLNKEYIINDELHEDKKLGEGSFGIVLTQYMNLILEDIYS